MLRFFQSSITPKLVAPIVLMALLLAGLLGTALVSHQRILSSRDAVDIAMKRQLQLGEIRSLSRSLQRDALNLIHEPDADERAKIAEKFAKRSDEMHADVTTAAKTLDGHDGTDFAALQNSVLGELARVKSLTETATADQALAHLRGAVRPAERKASALTDELIDRNQAAIAALEEEARAVEARQMLLVATLAIVASALTIGFAIFITLRSVVRPVEAVTHAMSELAANNLDTVVPASDRIDEIGAMQRTLGIFREGLIERARLQQQADAEAAREHQRTLERQREAEEKQRVEAEARRDAENAATAARKKAEAMERVIAGFEADIADLCATFNKSAEELRARAAMLTESASTTGVRSTSVAAAAKQTNDNVQSVAAATEELSATIAEVGQQVGYATQATGDAVQEASNTQVCLDGLVSSAAKVASIVDIIDAIASKTNLLALNATIEASRAGEAGRGFAVVASEVKGLAAQTASATKSITEQVADMREASGRVTEAMDKISDRIGSIDEIAATIAAAIQEQGAATGGIAASVYEVANDTREVMSNIEHVAASAHETDVISNQIRADADALQTRVARLRETAANFIEEVRAA